MTRAQHGDETVSQSRMNALSFQLKGEFARLSPGVRKLLEEREHFQQLFQFVYLLATAGSLDQLGDNQRYDRNRAIIDQPGYGAEMGISSAEKLNPDRRIDKDLTIIFQGANLRGAAFRRPNQNRYGPLNAKAFASFVA